MNKPVRRIGMVLATLAGAVGIAVAGTVPALAAFDQGHECEVSHPVCVGAPVISWGAPVQETTSGRTLDVIPTTDPVFANVYKLRITTDTTKCLGVDTTENQRVIVKNCSGNDAIVWQRQQTGSGDNHRWMNVFESKIPGPWGGSHMCLTGNGSNGLAMIINDCGSGIQVLAFSGHTVT